MNNNPIGIFDSGVGGLSVWKEIVSLLPQESIVYIGDQKNIPYGEKSSEDIHILAKKALQFLGQQKVKLIVIACNTVTVSCLDVLRIDFPDIPIIGTVPVVKLAAEKTKNKKIGILSTVRTSESHYQKHIIEEFAPDCEVVNIGTNKLVPRIEQGDIRSEKLKQLLERELRPFQEKNVDTVALGCTHFPFIEYKIAEVLGNNVQLLDSGAPIARQVKRVLEHNQSLSSVIKPNYQFYTTGEAADFESVAKKLVDEKFSDKIGAVEKVSL